MAECGVQDCDRGASRRGWCHKHYTRWRIHGDPLTKLNPPGLSPATEATFWSRVVQDGECWVWTGAKHEAGYGRMLWKGRTRPAHRLAYEFMVGDIPPGLDLDHLCRNPSCVRPDHLDPVTRKENLRRGIGAQVTRERHAARRAAAVGG